MGASVDSTILHTFLSAPACTDMGSIFFTSEVHIRAVMYMPCVKCSCSGLETWQNIDRSAYFLRFDKKKMKKTEEIPFWV